MRLFIFSIVLLRNIFKLAARNFNIKIGIITFLTEIRRLFFNFDKNQKLWKN